MGYSSFVSLASSVRHRRRNKHTGSVTGPLKHVRRNDSRETTDIDCTSHDLRSTRSSSSQEEDEHDDADQSPLSTIIRESNFREAAEFHRGMMEWVQSTMLILSLICTIAVRATSLAQCLALIVMGILQANERYHTNNKSSMIRQNMFQCAGVCLVFALSVGVFLEISHFFCVVPLIDYRQCTNDNAFVRDGDTWRVG